MKRTPEDPRLRQIGRIICSFANAGCLCFEKDKPLCRNVLDKAEDVLAIASIASSPDVAELRPPASGKNGRAQSTGRSRTKG